MPRAPKKVSPTVAEPPPAAAENPKIRRGKRPAETPAEENPSVPSKAPRTVLGKSKQPKVNGVTATTSVQSSSNTKDETNGATLYCFGTNDCGQLGFECEKRKYPALVPSLQAKKIVAIACGGMHTLALEENGKVWSFGLNDDMALGRHTAEEEDAFEPALVDLPAAEKITQISAGDSHSAALTTNGEVFAWGCFKDDNGNYGLVADDGPICREKPVKITEHLNIKMKKIASGAHHIAMLGEDGQLYTCGTGGQGQLGRKEPEPKRLTRSMAHNGAVTGSPVSKKENLLKPSLVKIGRNPKISNVWTGEFATYCLSAKGNEVYVCGLNNYAQLGIKSRDDNKNVIDVPTKNNSFKGKIWREIAAGQHHAVALDKEGNVYTIGRSSDGRLGLGTDAMGREGFDEPQLVDGLAGQTCVHVASGGSTSYAVTNKGQVYAWGFGENYQLASGADDEDKNIPTICKGSKDRDNIDGNVLAVAAGGQHVALTILLPRKVNGNS